MLSMTEDDGMAKRASQAGDARTTDRKGALCLDTEANARGKRRRWTAERKHQIVADGSTPWCVGFDSEGSTGWPATDWIEDIMLRTAGLDTYAKWATHQI